MNPAKKTILVTGGAGLLGHHVVRALEERSIPTSRIQVPRRETCDLRLWANCTPGRKLDVGRVEPLFGFRARTNFEDGLRRTVDWYQQADFEMIHPALT